MLAMLLQSSLIFLLALGPVYHALPALRYTIPDDALCVAFTLRFNLLILLGVAESSRLVGQVLFCSSLI